jgi:predicted membrane-bound mannosyltransferase
VFVNCTNISNELFELRAAGLSEMLVTIKPTTVSYSRRLESDHVLPNFTVKWIAFVQEVLGSNLDPKTIYIN